MLKLPQYRSFKERMILTRIDVGPAKAVCANWCSMRLQKSSCLRPPFLEWTWYVMVVWATCRAHFFDFRVTFFFLFLFTLPICQCHPMSQSASMNFDNRHASESLCSSSSLAVHDARNVASNPPHICWWYVMVLCRVLLWALRTWWRPSKLPLRLPASVV